MDVMPVRCETALRGRFSWALRFGWGAGRPANQGALQVQADGFSWKGVGGIGAGEGCWRQKVVQHGAHSVQIVGVIAQRLAVGRSQDDLNLAASHQWCLGKQGAERLQALHQGSPLNLHGLCLLQCGLQLRWGC